MKIQLIEDACSIYHNPLLTPPPLSRLLFLLTTSRPSFLLEKVTELLCCYVYASIINEYP